MDTADLLYETLNELLQEEIEDMWRDVVVYDCWYTGNDGSFAVIGS